MGGSAAPGRTDDSDATAPDRARTARRAFLVLTGLALAGCSSGNTGPSPAPTAPGTPSPTHAPTPRPTRTPRPTPSRTPTPSPTRSHRPGPTRTPTPTRSPSPTPSHGHAGHRPDWRALAHSVDGTLRLPGDAGYGTAHQLFDPDFDSLRPAAVLTAASADDVATAVGWAGHNDVVVTGRSGGHSYVGASAASGALVIDVRNLSTVRMDGHDAVIGAGANLATVYDRLGAAGRAIPGGSCPTVGIAGLTLGGGVGWAVRGYGLTCDRIQAVELVGADGRRRSITAADPDLFWASRGGGGGMVGIATEFRLRTVAAPRITTYYGRWLWSDAVHVVSTWQRWQAGRPAHVWSNLHLDVSPSNQDVIVFGADLSNGGDSVLDSLIAAVGIDPPGRIVRPDQRLGPDGSSQRQRFAAGTDIVLDRYRDGQIRRLVAGMATAADYGVAGSCIIDALGGAAGRARPDSAWPWRRAFGTVQWYVGLGAHASARPARNWIAHMHGCVPDNGGYINYLEKARPKAAHYLGRDNAARLARLRATTGADQRFVQPLAF